MPTASLFDTEEPPPEEPAPEPRYPAEPWLVDELVALGVTREQAQGYSLKQAFAVRASLTRAPGKKAPRKGTPLTDPNAPTVFRDGPNELPARGVSWAERQAVADALEAVLSDHEAGTASADEVYRTIRSVCYVFGRVEQVRVAKGLVLLLRGNNDGGSDDGDGTGGTGEEDAGDAQEIVLDDDHCGSGDAGGD